MRALGVIDVPVDLVPSGKLFAFIYQDQVLNDDFRNFEIFRPSKELGFSPVGRLNQLVEQGFVRDFTTSHQEPYSNFKLIKFFHAYVFFQKGKRSQIFL